MFDSETWFCKAKVGKWAKRKTKENNNYFLFEFV